MDTDTKQSARDTMGRFAPGNRPVAGFDKNIQNRHNGGWSKDRSVRGRLEKLLNDTTLGEFYEQIKHNNADNENERLGDVLLSGWVQQTIIYNDPDDPHKISVDSEKLQKLLEFVYGRKTENDTTLKGDDQSVPIIKGFVIPTIPEGFVQAGDPDNSL